VTSGPGSLRADISSPLKRRSIDQNEIAVNPPRETYVVATPKKKTEKEINK